MTEKYLEQKLVKLTKRRGGLIFKFVSPGRVGVPDRIIIFPEGRIGFVEVKKPGVGRLSKVQLDTLSRLSNIGCRVYVLDRPEVLEDILDDIQYPQKPLEEKQGIMLLDGAHGFYPQFEMWLDSGDNAAAWFEDDI